MTNNSIIKYQTVKSKDLDFNYYQKEYDREFNLLYLPVNPTIKTGIVMNKTEVDGRILSNLGIYDIKNDQLTHFFEEGSTQKILSYLYEKSYDETAQKMIFNRAAWPQVFNNYDIKERAKADRLFVLTELEGGEECQLWMSTRLGTNRQLLQTFPKKLDWCIDVYNRKVLFFYKLRNAIEVKALDW